MTILSSFLVLMGLGLLASIMLAVASKIFYVWEDPRIEQVEEALLGANCGGCGYAGCSAAAEAVIAGKAGPDICVAGGFEIAQAVAGVLGMSVEEKEPEISKPGCIYGFHEADLKYTYDGVFDCRAAMLLYGGSKECNIGCLGLGTCVRACPFGALSMGENNLPVVNIDRCTGCGICAEICPKDIITLSSAAKRIMSDYKVTECTAPCQRHCPAEIDIPEYIRRISKGDYLGAVRVIKEKNPFPLICGWICPNPCEFECRRNLIDEPVSINALKKYVSDYEKQTGKRALPTYLPPAEGKKVAVIGGGVEGLTASYYLRRLGHRPKVLEATEKMGGILRYVITEDRLPRDVLDWEIDGILDIGVESETGKVMGSDFTLSSLFAEGFEMVLLTGGGWDSKQVMRGKTYGETTIPGTYLLLDFLYTFSEGKKKLPGKKTIILGGGKTAVKAAKICLDNGAREVTVVYPYSKVEAESKGIEMEESGKIKYSFSAKPVELQGDGDNLKTVSIQTADGTIEELDLDNLIVGAGRFPEMLFVKTEEEGNKWKTIEIIKVLKEETGIGIFSIGETGRTNDLTGVVIAVRRGRKIARALQLYASEEEIAPEDRVIIDENELQNIYEITGSDSLQAHRGNIDSRLTLTEAEAAAQAERCLNCGLICYKKELDREKLNAISA